MGELNLRKKTSQKSASLPYRLYRNDLATDFRPTIKDSLVGSKLFVLAIVLPLAITKAFSHETESEPAW